jgi:hypothetical protein
MVDFNDYSEVIAIIETGKSPEVDNRQKAQEDADFLDDDQGQWEPDVINQLPSNMPKYTFDKCNPIVDQIAGEIEQADFDIKIRPAGGDGTKETAELFDGIIRNIESISNASTVYSDAARRMIECSIGGWEVVQDWVDADSFDQDLLIKPVEDFRNRVWYDPGAQSRDMSDANWCTIETDMSTADYDEQFPDGSGMSIGDTQQTSSSNYKKESVKVGRFLYKKQVKKTLIEFSDGSVREENDDLEKVLDEFADKGVVEKRRRVKDTTEVWSRLYDGGKWLNEAQKTAFKSWLPIIPVFGNFKISNGKIIYRSAIRKLKDPARVYNYTRTRETIDIIISPKSKYWMTDKQVAGNEAELQDLNTSLSPVQTYNNDPAVPGPPQYLGGAIINAGIVNAAQTTSRDLTEASGLFGLNQGDIQDNTLSGKAIGKLQNKGDNASRKYFKAAEAAICHTARILVEAIPVVMDTTKQIRVLSEDGSFSMKSINETVFDEEARTNVVANDLSRGKYDVTCDVGPAFKNRQEETVESLMALIAIIPGIGEVAPDILLNNIATPGIDLAAERVRKQLLTSGVIPESQQTDEEKEELARAKAEAQNQQQEPTPEDKIATAEIARVQAETASVQANALLKAEDLKLKAEKQADDKALNEIKVIMQQQTQSMNSQQAIIQANQDGQQLMFDQLNQLTQSLKDLREATGADAIVSPTVIETYEETAELTADKVDQIENL